ncbi:hypothetical protein LU293_00190 [Moraxella nasovis]|uniref:hypothetical protein n=1 Tax=Moraxella nasovis TaxID=2904121 RepID=UPI001F609E32|nr:hypothetical protein [Moraxella nasovis]UNU73372.1 hypothetical protein LU293_00190 [Moraxella nasovis]
MNQLPSYNEAVAERKRLADERTRINNQLQHKKLLSELQDYQADLERLNYLLSTKIEQGFVAVSHSDYRKFIHNCSISDDFKTNSMFISLIFAGYSFINIIVGSILNLEKKIKS